MQFVLRNLFLQISFIEIKTLDLFVHFILRNLFLQNSVIEIEISNYCCISFYEIFFCTFVLLKLKPWIIFAFRSTKSIFANFGHRNWNLEIFLHFVLRNLFWKNFVHRNWNSWVIYAFRSTKFIFANFVHRNRIYMAAFQYLFYFVRQFWSNGVCYHSWRHNYVQFSVVQFFAHVN